MAVTITCESTGGKVTWSQLALACWLQFKLSNSPSTAFDPVFTPVDKQLLRALHFEVTRMRHAHVLHIVVAIESANTDSFTPLHS